MWWQPVGDTGWLHEIAATGDPAADAATVLTLALTLRKSTKASRIVDIVPAAVTVLVTCEPDDHAEVGRALAGLDPSPGVGDREAGVRLGLRVAFDGADLASAEDWAGLAPDELVARVTGTRWTVAFVGFAPGFAYMVGGGLRVPRLAAPRPRVPPGSLALAGPYAGIYPSASPGGWRLVGRLVGAPALFDPGRPGPALLPPGAVVGFEAA